MKRNFLKKLLEWKDNKINKPLMVIGARQIGKTYLINDFCKNNYENYIYINLEKEDNIRNVFEKSINPEEIIKEIEFIRNKKIDVNNTIIFFDEVQVSERFITSLKYFCESENQYKIICAGSLLGVKINRFNSSFPVGKIKIEYMYPMTFDEFLMAIDEEELLERIRNSYETLTPISEYAHKLALNYYRTYLCVGGMPEAIQNYIENNKDLLSFDSGIPKSIIEMYKSDMNKYTLNNSETIKIEKVYNSIPSQLAKENKKFQYSIIELGANKRKYETSLDWLITSNIAYKCTSLNKIEIPIKVYEDINHFKLYLSDVGILTNACDINYSDIILDKPFMYKGVLAENYIAQTFTANNIPLHYWTSGNMAEVDFIINNNDGIIPIEVKASENNTSKSLKVYMEKYKPIYAIRVSSKNFGFENNIKSIPLYAVFCITK